MKLSFNHWKGVSTPSKTLIFLSLQILKKMAWERVKATFFLFTFLPKKPRQAKRWFLMESEAIHEMPKQLTARSQIGWANWQWNSKWFVDSKSPLHMKHMLTKIFPFFCRLSHVSIFLGKEKTFKGAKVFYIGLQGKPPSKWASDDA